EKSLETQKQVVSEEFKQRYLNQPYGDVWLKLRPLAYKQHPYKWATIGKEISHIELASIQDVKDFFKKHYTPQNAILVIAGDVDVSVVKDLAEKWFGSISSGTKYIRNLEAEPKQLEARREVVTANVPVNSLYMAFHMSDRRSKDYYTCDLISDILSRGNSSRLYRRLVKEQSLFSEINAYLLGSLDNGLFIVEGKPLPGTTMELAENAVWEQLRDLQNTPVLGYELEKVKNKIESTMVFAEMSILDKAMNLAYFELLGNADMLNDEVVKYLNVSPEDIQKTAQQIFQLENSSTLFYLAS